MHFNLLRVPWTARRSNQSILKEISPGCSLEGMMLKLKLQYFGHLMQRADSLEKTLMLGGIGGRRRKRRQRMRWLDGITDSMDKSGWTLGVCDGQGGLACCNSWRHKESDMTEQLNWTESLHFPAEQARTWKLRWFESELRVSYKNVIFSLHLQNKMLEKKSQNETESNQRD